jgi:hypothetical protein
MHTGFLRLPLAVLVIVVCGTLASSVMGQETPEPEPDILIESASTFRLRPDQGTLHVSVSATVTHPEGSSLVPDKIQLPLIKGAEHVRAVEDGGANLQTQVETGLDRPYARGTVTFGRRLGRGESISFQLDYDLTQVAADDYTYVASDFIYVPLFAIGQTASVHIEVPSDHLWYSLVEPIDCEREGAIAEQRFVCSDSNGVYDAAHVMLVDQSGYASLEATVETSAGPQTFELRYLATDGAWASQVREVVIRGLPVLEAIFGVPLEVRDDFTLLEVFYGELGGYDGVFYCVEEELCRIGMVQDASEHVVLHELAHLWTTKHEQRWLAEGLAEYAAHRATRELGLPTQPPFSAPYAEALYLDEWSNSLVTVPSEEAYLRELAGYRESLAFFDDLEAAVGSEAIRRANALVDGLDEVDSRDYLDALDEASGASVSHLFRERVFAPSFSATLDRRAQAKESLQALLYITVNSPYSIRPEKIEALIADWNFFEALDQIDHAKTYMTAYPAAEEASSDVSLWARLGLIGKDPEADLAAAKSAFDSGDYIEAGQRADAARLAYANASDTARERVLMGFAGVVVIGVLILGGTWAFRGAQGSDEAAG